MVKTSPDFDEPLGCWRVSYHILGCVTGSTQQLYEAAEIDGASIVQRFLKITIPMISPTIFFNSDCGHYWGPADVYGTACHDRWGPYRFDDVLRCLSLQNGLPLPGDGLCLRHGLGPVHGDPDPDTPHFQIVRFLGVYTRGDDKRTIDESRALECKWHRQSFRSTVSKGSQAATRRQVADWTNSGVYRGDWRGTRLHLALHVDGIHFAKVRSTAHREDFVSLLPNPIVWSNYYDAVFGQIPFPRYFLNSIIITVVPVAANVIMSSLVAFSLPD